MVVAVVAAIVALLLVVAVILIVFAVRNRSKGSFASVKKSVRSIDSVGVSSSLAESEAKKPAAGTKVSSVNPADALKPRFAATGVLGDPRFPFSMLHKGLRFRQYPP